jgi:hypothetical protein
VALVVAVASLSHGGSYVEALPLEGGGVDVAKTAIDCDNFPHRRRLWHHRLVSRGGRCGDALWPA